MMQHFSIILSLTMTTQSCSIAFYISDTVAEEAVQKWEGGLFKFSRHICMENFTFLWRNSEKWGAPAPSLPILPPMWYCVACRSLKEKRFVYYVLSVASYNLF